MDIMSGIVPLASSEASLASQSCRATVPNFRLTPISLFICCHARFSLSGGGGGLML